MATEDNTKTSTVGGTTTAGTTTPKDGDKTSTPKQSAAPKPLGDALAAGKAHLEGSTKPAAGSTAVMEKPVTPAKTDDASAAKGGNKKPADASKKPADKKPDAKLPEDSTAPAGEIVRKVKIEEMTVLSRGGLNTDREERWPFTELGLSTKQRDGSIKGPSFFIPEGERPEQEVASARKRIRGMDLQFITRKTFEIVEGEEDKGKQTGVRVWKAKGGTAK